MRMLAYALVLLCAGAMEARADVVSAVLKCRGDPCVVYDNPGGLAGAFIHAARVINAGARHKVIFRGRCSSACSLLADRIKRTACVEPTARFGFHLAWRQVQEDIQLGRKTLTRVYVVYEDPSPLYSKPVVQWVNEHGGFKKETTIMSAPEAWKFWAKCK